MFPTDIEMAPLAHNQNALRHAMMTTLQRHEFLKPSYEIHGGVAGLYDFRPNGCILNRNVIEEWRKVCTVLQK